MKIKNVLLAVLALCAVNTMVACNDDEPSSTPSVPETPSTPSIQESTPKPSDPVHTHTWGSDWEYDETNHWHVCADTECNEIDAKAIHEWDEGEITTQPTEETEGVKTFGCTVCDATKTEPVAKLNHTHKPAEEWSTDGTSHWKVCSGCNEKVDLGTHGGGNATCEAAAECEVCAAAYGEALGHTEVVDEAVAATCTEKGLTEGKHCSVCETVLKAQEEVAALGHTEVVDKAVAATCTEKGLTEGKHCSVCETVLKAQEEVAALGHDYVHQSYVEIEGVWYSHQVCVGDETHTQDVATDMVKVAINGVAYENLSSAIAAAEAGTEITLLGDVEEKTAIVIEKDLTINLNEKTISIPSDTDGSGVFHVTSGTLTINGKGTINGVGQNNYSMAIWADGGNVVINGGTYTNVGALANAQNDLTHFDLIYVKNGGKVTINGGTFICETPQWTLNSNDSLVGSFEVKGGSFYKYNPAVSETENPVANFVADGYVSIKRGDNYEVEQKGMIAEYTFENGLTNSGISSNVNSFVFSNETDTRGQVLDVDATTYIHSTAEQDSKALGTNAFQSGHVGSRPSLGLSGIDTGSSDFTISVKVWHTHMYWDKNSSSSKNGQYYIIGTADSSVTTAKVAAPYFNIRLYKKNNSDAYYTAQLTINGEVKDLFVSNTTGYFQADGWTEYRIVKKGTSLTVSVIPTKLSAAKTDPFTATFELNSAEDVMITPEQVLGLGCNYSASRPGNYSYYDDLKVWNYAVDFE